MFFFVDRKYTNETRDPMVSEGCLLFLIFYETTRPIGTTFGGNVHWMVL
jgi:acyl-CoA hydrolase